jgi:hypothetical protein
VRLVVCMMVICFEICVLCVVCMVKLPFLTRLETDKHLEKSYAECAFLQKALDVDFFALKLCSTVLIALSAVSKSVKVMKIWLTVCLSE